jgi:hypothetical protein
MPYSLEVNDVITYSQMGMSPLRYADVLKRHFDQLLAEGDTSGTVMCIPLHAYLVSQPNRIAAFETALEHVVAHRDDVWITTAAEIADYYRTHYWQSTIDDIARRGLNRGGVGFDHDAA